MRLKDFLASQPKVIARTRRGEIYRGHLQAGQAGRQLTRGTLRLKTLDGRDFPLDLDQLKGVFFVRDFQGNKDFMESKVFTQDPEQPGLRVRIRFDDNETLEGVVENSIELLQTPGFFLWPADPKSNNRLIFVVKSALLGFRVLGLK